MTADVRKNFRQRVTELLPNQVRQGVRDWRARRAAAAYERQAAGRTTEQIFTAIWSGNRWGSAESCSGSGSELASTTTIRAELPRLVRTLGVRTLLDAPCGDFNWMRHVPLGCRYIGMDIVRALIEENQRQHGGPDRTFLHGDITAGPLPPADLVLCRDCLFHLTDEQVFAALRQFAACGARWVLATTYPDALANRPGVTGGYRDLNLCKPPFSLRAPRELVEEGAAVGATTVGARRAIGLWSVDDLPVPIG